MTSSVSAGSSAKSENTDEKVNTFRSSCLFEPLADRPLLPWELETCWMLRFGESRQHHPSGCRSGRPTSFLGLHCQGPDTGDYPAAGDLGSGSFGSQRRNGVLNTPGLKGGAVIKTGHVVLRSIWIILSLAVLLYCQYVFDGKPNSDAEE